MFSGGKDKKTGLQWINSSFFECFLKKTRRLSAVPEFYLVRSQAPVVEEFLTKILLKAVNHFRKRASVIDI